MIIDRIWKSECDLQHFTKNFRIKNFNNLERDEADVYLWRAGLEEEENEEERNDHMLHYEHVLGNVFERKVDFVQY